MKTRVLTVCGHCRLAAIVPLFVPVWWGKDCRRIRWGLR